jgi:hypothetical protein
MTFNEYMGGDKGQDLRNFDRGIFKAVNHVIEVGVDEFRRNRVIRNLKDFLDDYTVIVDVYIHGNERRRGDLTPVMKHFNAKYYRVLVECLRELSLMAAGYYKTTAKSYKNAAKGGECYSQEDIRRIAKSEREVDRLISSTMPEMTVGEENAIIRGEGPLRMSESDKETILEDYAHITKMEWFKKERGKREKTGKPSVEKVAVERKSIVGGS